ncbi:hypothetical protein ILYODFUR_028376 [Ilyodon furcidens]|uniref:Secreted protein n=1 Tax=Ilyodon furcidens TaxID=33524 RepID=A0ABV0VKE2_9TELE
MTPVGMVLVWCVLACLRCVIVSVSLSLFFTPLQSFTQLTQFSEENTNSICQEEYIVLLSQKYLFSFPRDSEFMRWWITISSSATVYSFHVSHVITYVQHKEKILNFSRKKRIL